jgi:hypothetical protein
VLFTADAHRDDGKRFIVSADERLTAFLELERQAAYLTAILDKRDQLANSVFT